MFTDIAIPLLGLLLLAAVLLLVNRRARAHGTGRDSEAALARAGAWGRRMAARLGDWWHASGRPVLRRLAIRAGLRKEQQPGWEPAAEPPPRTAAAPGPPFPEPAAVPEPVPVLTGAAAAVPADHAAVQARIAGFEPEDDAALLVFYAQEGAAAGGYAQAWEAHAEMLANAIGLDPAFTHVAAQLAESASELGHDFAMVRARLGQVYAGVQQFVADGGVLPFEARRFLTGEGF